MRVLVTVKAYPQPSRSHGETVCVAGVRIDTPTPSWIRLYPVTYRELAFDDRFAKYQIVELKAFRAPSDQRPESYKPNLPSARLGDKLDSGRGWKQRWRYLDPLAGAVTACELIARQHEPSAPSLGLIKPREITKLIVDQNPDFSADKKALAQIAARDDLFSQEGHRSLLEPAPFRLRYRYLCAAADCPSHTQSLIDWEAGQAARKWRAEGRSDQETSEALRQKFHIQMCAPDRDTYFFLGNQHKRPKGFMVLGVFWPPAASRPEPTLF